MGRENGKVMEHPLITPRTVGFILAALGYFLQRHSLLSAPHGQHELMFSGPEALASRSQCLDELALEITWLNKSPGTNCI